MPIADCALLASSQTCPDPIIAMFVPLVHIPRMAHQPAHCVLPEALEIRRVLLVVTVVPLAVILTEVDKAHAHRANWVHLHNTIIRPSVFRARLVYSLAPQVPLSVLYVQWDITARCKVLRRALNVVPVK